MTQKYEEIIASLSKMNIIEIIELTKEIEKKFNITVNTNNINTTQANIEPIKEETKQEQTSYSVIIKSFGNDKINVIKTVRMISELGLKEAKNFIENLPSAIKENIPKIEAEKIKKQLEDSGATVELK